MIPEIGTTGAHARSGQPVRVVAVSGDVIVVEYLRGPSRGLRAPYHADEIGDFIRLSAR